MKKKAEDSGRIKKKSETRGSVKKKAEAESRIKKKNEAEALVNKKSGTGGGLKKKIIIASSILAVMLLAAGVFFVLRHMNERTVESEIDGLIKISSLMEAERITPKDIKKLPDPVKKYLAFSGAMGRSKIRFVRMKQKGEIRLKQGGDWIPFDAEQYNFTGRPSFLWLAKSRFMNHIDAAVRDYYLGGKGGLVVKLFSAITVTSTAGKEFDQGELLRYLAESALFHTALAGENIEWKAIDRHSARAVLRDGDTTVTGVFHFGDTGEITGFEADRYMMDGGDVRLEKWSGVLRNYAKTGGMMIPMEAEVTWHLKTGDFTYVRMKITGIEFDVMSQYKK